MRKVTLFIAMSVDGFIADEQGNVDWLTGQDPNGDTMASYTHFIQQVDTVIMGWKTYHQISTELSPEKWPYSDLETYVITHRDEPSTNEIQFTRENPCDLLRRLKKAEGRGIWICGGAYTARQLMEEDLIDRYHFCVIPILLGNGIPLFAPSERENKLKLFKTESYNGITDLVYERR